MTYKEACEHDKLILKEQERSEAAIKINDLIQEHFNILLVTCGACGKILSTTSPKPEKEICPHCETEGDNSDYPDLFY